MSKQSPDYLTDIATQAIECAQKHGADAADAVIFGGESTSVVVRNGETEDITRAESSDLGLRVLVGQAQAIVSSSKFASDELDTLAERAVAMAKLAPSDPHAGLAERDQVSRDRPDLDLADDAHPDTDELLALARRCDEAGRAVDGVSTAAGSSASASRRLIVLAASNGFCGHYERTGYGYSASMIAGEGTGMERDYEYRSAVHRTELPSPEEIGREAGERVIRRLNPRKAASQSVPVVYERRVASTLVGHFASAINGSSVARGTTFLKDAMGDQLFDESISIVDDARRPRGHGSKPFDAEGLATGKLELIADGVLQSWLLDLYSARQLGLSSNGHASRGTSSTPSPSASNLDLMPGSLSPQELIGNIKQGFWVSELLGMGVNGTTGDYSRGASGFWIEDGELADPVSEITIAGNLKDMFRALTPANDLERRGSVNAPTCCIEGMTIAGV